MTSSNYQGFPDMIKGQTQPSPLSSRASTGKIDVTVQHKRKKRNSVFNYIVSKSKLPLGKSKKEQSSSQGDLHLTMTVEEEKVTAAKYHQKRRHSRLDANEPIEDVFAGIEFKKMETKRTIKITVPQAAITEEEDSINSKDFTLNPHDIQL